MYQGGERAKIELEGLREASLKSSDSGGYCDVSPRSPLMPEAHVCPASGGAGGWQLSWNSLQKDSPVAKVTPGGSPHSVTGEKNCYKIQVPLSQDMKSWKAIPAPEL